MADRTPSTPDEWDEAFSLATVACRACRARGLHTVLDIGVPDGTAPGQVFEAVCVVCACQPQAPLLYTDTSPFTVLAVRRVPLVG